MFGATSKRGPSGPRFGRALSSFCWRGSSPRLLGSNWLKQEECRFFGLPTAMQYQYVVLCSHNFWLLTTHNILPLQANILRNCLDTSARPFIDFTLTFPDAPCGACSTCCLRTPAASRLTEFANGRGEEPWTLLISMANGTNMAVS